MPNRHRTNSKIRNTGEEMRRFEWKAIRRAICLRAGELPSSKLWTSKIFSIRHPEPFFSEGPCPRPFLSKPHANSWAAISLLYINTFPTHVPNHEIAQVFKTGRFCSDLNNSRRETAGVSAVQVKGTPMRPVRRQLSGSCLERRNCPGLPRSLHRLRHSCMKSATRSKARLRMSSSGSVTKRKWAVPGR